MEQLIDKLVERNWELRIYKHALELEVRELKDKLAELNEKDYGLLNDNNYHTSNNAILEGEIEGLKKKCHEKNGRINDLLRKCHRQARELDRLNNRLAELNEKHNRLEYDSDTYKTTYKHWRDLATDRAIKINDIENENNELKQKLELFETMRDHYKGLASVYKELAGGDSIANAHDMPT